MNGIRFYCVVWNMDTNAGTIETTIEASHSRRYLADQIKRGEVNGGKKKYIKIQEIETPLIEVEYIKKAFEGKTTKKERDAHQAQTEYVLQLILSHAARLMLPEGTVIER